MKLSIIMPVFNEADTIAEIIAKVRSVPLPQYELVLVNDASTDGSGKILDSYASQPNTRVLHHPVNRGKGAALATGLQGASGEVAVIQDADMEYDPFDLLRMLALGGTRRAGGVWSAQPCQPKGYDALGQSFLELFNQCALRRTGARHGNLLQNDDPPGL
jgi:glycosyltransferase involved in cell wall biosynthesis